MKPTRLLRHVGAWTLRVVAALVLLLAASALFLRSDAAGNYAASRLAEALSAAAKRPAKIGSARIDVFPPAIRLEDVEVELRGGKGSAPLLRVKSASVHPSVADMIFGRIVIDVIEADGVEVSLLGEEAAPPGGPRKPASGRPVTLRRVNVRNGSLTYRSHRAPFEVDASDLEATAASVECAEPPCLEGAVRTGPFRLAWQEHRLAGTAISISASLAGSRLELNRFSVAGPSLHAAGTATWSFADPVGGDVRGRLSTTGDATASILGPLPVKAESLDVRMSAHVTEERIEARGSATMTRIDYPGIAKADAAEGEFTLKEGALTTDVHVRGLSPSVAGFVPASAGAGTLHLERSESGDAVVSFDADPILFRDILARLDPRLPVADVHVRSAGEVRWHTGDPNTLAGTARLNLTPLQGEGGATPATAGVRTALSGSMTLGISPQTFSLQAGRFSIPGLDAQLEGKIRRGDGRMDLEIVVPRIALEEALPLLHEFPPASLAGSHHLRGEASGRIIAGGLPSSMRLSGSFSGPAISIEPDPNTFGPFSAEGRFEYASPVLRVADLSLAGEGWTAAGDLDLDTSAAWPLRRAKLSLSNLPARPLWDFLGLTYLAGGALSGEGAYDIGDAAGEHPIHLTLTAPVIAGMPSSGITLDAVARGETISIRSLSVAADAGVVEASGEVVPDARKARLDVRSAGLDLASLVASVSPETQGISGKLSFAGEVSAAPEGLRARGDLQGQEVNVRGVAIGSVTGTIESDPEDFRGMVLSLQAPALGVSGEIGYDTSIGKSAELDLAFQDLSLDLLKPLLPAGTVEGLAGKGSGKIWGTVPVADPAAAVVTLRFDSIAFSASETTLAATEPVLVTLEDGEIWIAQSRFAGEDSELTITGVYDLRGRKAGAGSVVGRLDAGLLKLVVPEIQGRGAVDVEIHATAAAEGLRYSGRIATDSVWLIYPGLPTPIVNLKGTATISPDGTLQISGVSFEFAGGTVTGEGKGRLQGIGLARTEIRLRGSNLRSNPVPNLTVLFDADVTIRKEGAEGSIGGRIEIVRAVYRKEFGLGGAAGQSPVSLTERARASRPSIGLDLQIVAPSEVWVRTSTARLEGSARLQVKGTLARPEVTGRISVFEGGKILFRDVTYRTEAGGMDFDDPDVVDPLLDLSATTQVREYSITLHLTGRYSRPRFEMTSEPALSQRDIVALLVTGKTYTEGIGSETGAGAIAEENVAWYLTAPITSGLTEGVGRALRLTSVQVEPQIVSLNGKADPTARLTMTKRVSPDLFFVYSTNLGNTQEQIYQFQYDLSRVWQLLGSRDVDGSVSGDLTFRHRWGGPKRPAPGAGGPAGLASTVTAERIEVTGAPEELEERARKSVKLKEGKIVTRADALEARENLREYLARHSYPLAEVELTQQAAAPPGGSHGDGAEADVATVQVRYEIEPGPRVDLEIEGSRQDRKLKSIVLDAWVNAVDVDDLAPTGKEAIVNQLGGEGRAAAEVTPNVKRTERKVSVRYEIDPGPKVHVSSISFQGVSAVPADELSKAIATKEDRWNTFGKLRTPALTADVDRIRGAYLGRGYLDVEVSAPVISLSEDRKHADLTFRIKEGVPWTIGKVAIEGLTDYPLESLTEATLLKPGYTLKPSAVDSAVERVRDVLDAHGFNTVRVTSRIDGPPESASVAIVVEQGPRQNLDRVLVRGNTLTSSRVIQREITTPQGGYLSRGSMLEAQRNLYSLGIFRSVEMRNVSDPDDPSKAKLVVDVVEGDPFLTSWGAGYNTEAGPQGFVTLGHNNLFGTARYGAFTVRGSSISRRVQLTMGDRRLFGIPFDGLVTSFWEKNERESFDEKRVSAGVQFHHKLNPRLTAFGRYNIEDVSLTNVDLSGGNQCDVEFRDCRLANVAGSVAVDTRDDILAPKAGTFSTADLRLFLTAVGSEQQFAKVYTSIAGFRKIGDRVVLAGSVRLGVGVPFAATTHVPLTERFFMGGDTTLRGFRTDEAGPLQAVPDPNALTDPNLPDYDIAPNGGELSILLNGEVRFPVWRSVGGVLFYDYGNVFLDASVISLSGTQVLSTAKFGAPGAVFIQDGFRKVLGAGVRLDTPLGPVRLEYGRKMDRHFGAVFCGFCDPGQKYIHRNESPYEIFLSVGQAF